MLSCLTKSFLKLATLCGRTGCRANGLVTRRFDVKDSYRYNRKRLHLHVTCAFHIVTGHSFSLLFLISCDSARFDSTQTRRCHYISIFVNTCTQTYGAENSTDRIKMITHTHMRMRYKRPNYICILTLLL